MLKYHRWSKDQIQKVEKATAKAMDERSPDDRNTNGIVSLKNIN